MTAIKLKKHRRKRRILFLSLVRKWNRRLRKNSRGSPTRRTIILPSNGPNWGCLGDGPRKWGVDIWVLIIKIP